MAYVYRLEQLNETLVNKVNFGPWRGSEDIARWAVAKDFYDVSDDDTYIYFRPPHVHGVEMRPHDVCVARSYQELNDWFPNRFKRKESYRVVKYYTPNDVLTDLPNQAVVNAEHLKQVAVLEMFG